MFPDFNEKFLLGKGCLLFIQDTLLLSVRIFDFLICFVSEHK